MKKLTIKDYNFAEKKGIRYLPNRIIECCLPVTFNLVGYPTRVEEEEELYRYIDVMQETRFEHTVKDILGGVTKEEYEAFKKINEIVLSISEKWYGKKAFATASFLRALNVFRHIKMLYPERDTLILEIGAGSGYLGALLLYHGYAYASMDITQAFYCYQNHLLNAVAPGRVIELADPSERRELADIKEVERGTALHIPWWKFYTPNPQFKIRPHVISCNHALCEMHPHSLTYILKLSHQMLSSSASFQSNSAPAFLFEGWGSTIKTPLWVIGKRFTDEGFCIAHNDMLISVFVPKTSSDAEHALTLPYPLSNSPIDHPPSYMTHGWDIMWQPTIHTQPLNPIGKKILENRTKLKKEYNYEQLHNLVKSWMPEKNTLSDDEIFLRFLGRNL